MYRYVYRDLSATRESISRAEDGYFLFQTLLVIQILLKSVEIAIKIVRNKR